MFEGAVYVAVFPLTEIVPAPVAGERLQVTAGLVALVTVAVNGWLWEAVSVAVAGVTETVVCAEAGKISIALMAALFTTVVNCIVIPDVAVTANALSTAISPPPAAAKMSKLDNTVCPLIATLKVRWPAPVHTISA